MENASFLFTYLVQEIKICERCRLRSTCTQVVPGAGPPQSTLMFIGEGPGKSEDEKGVPFVGSAGKFLDEMLSAIHYTREDVYIANAVKCRPPQNRDPLPDEIASCRPWLIEQIRFIQPKLIITLGRHSMGMFLPGKKISDTHGKAFRALIPELDQSFVFLTLYHPAAALYNGGMRTTLMADFQKIPKLIEKIIATNKSL